MKLKDVVMLGGLAAIWGSSFLFIKIGAMALGPAALIELRVLLATLALLVFAYVRRHRVRILHRWWQYLVLGATNAAIPFTLIATAELRLDSGLAAILNATTPMFTAIVAWLWTKDPFTLGKLAGVLLGIVGVGVLVGGSGSHGAGLWLPAGFSLLAALAYGVAGVFSARHFHGETPLDMAIGQQLAATLVLLPVSLLTWRYAEPSGTVVFAVVMLAVVCTAAAYLLYFALIHSVGALRTLTVTFLVPVFAVVWGAVFLGEAISWRTVVGLAVILSSVALVVRRGRRAEVAGRQAVADPRAVTLADDGASERRL